MKSLPAKEEKYSAAETARRFKASLLGAFKATPKAKASTKTATQKQRAKKKPKA